MRFRFAIADLIFRKYSSRKPDSLAIFASYPFRFDHIYTDSCYHIIRSIFKADSKR